MNGKHGMLNGIINTNMETIVLRRFDNYFSAHIMKSKLEDTGIHCYLFDENSVTVNPVFSNAIGNIKLVVADYDEKRATEALEKFDAEYLANSICPKCKTGNFIMIPAKSPKNFITSILTWMFSNYAVSVNYIYHCRQCGYETEQLPEPELPNE